MPTRQSRRVPPEQEIAEPLDGPPPPAGRHAERACYGATECWQLVVDCHDEAQQRELYGRLTAKGLRCRVITL